MAWDVTEIQERIASLVDQDVDTPTVGGDEWKLRLKYINRAIEQWGQAYDWEALRKEYWFSISGMSRGSLSLPADFEKVAGYPLYHSSGVDGGEEWTVINSEIKKQYDDEEQYCYVLGNRQSGHTLVWNPASIASGASMVASYYSYPTSVASPANTIIVPDPEYVVHRVSAFIFESRSDARFQETEVKARETLLNMVDREHDRKFSGYGAGKSTDVKTDLSALHGFRVGRD